MWLNQERTAFMSNVFLQSEIETSFRASMSPCIFDQDKQKVESCLAAMLSKGLEAGWNPVPKAMEYAVMGQAQRVRPILALRVARMLKAETDDTLRAAAAVELIHSASLIIDDLPCMDNESIRRGRPAVHLQYGEPTAILGAFSMVAMAARVVMEGAESSNLRRFQMALLKTLDCSSLIGGQSMDLALVGDERNAQRSAVNDMKTVPLFQLAVEAGCVALPEGVPGELEAFGRHFGVAFQLTDDFIDGELEDRKILDETYEQCRASLQHYGAHAEPLLELVQYLEQRTHV